MSDPKTISDTRDQLHWATQLLSAAADAKLEKADDDSHSNVGWDGKNNQLAGRSGCTISVENFTLNDGSQSLSLGGKTLEEAREWLSDSLGEKLVFRDYEMPAHAVKDGAPFNPESAHLESICSWFSFAQNELADRGELRIWPHHFDMGFWAPGEVDGKSIGGGFSLGDSSYDQPYFYINPYGVDRPEGLTDLPVGHWSDHWFGAVLTSEEMDSWSGDNADAARNYIRAAVEACEGLFKQ